MKITFAKLFMVMGHSEMPAKGSASWERRYGFTHWASAGCALRREAGKSGGRLAGHTAGRLSEQGLCIPGAEKVGVLSYLAYGLFLEDIFIKRIRTAFWKQVCVASI